MNTMRLHINRDHALPHGRCLMLPVQKTLWMAATQPPGGPAAFLPAQATPSDASKASSASSSSSTSAPHTKDGEQEPELRIAWQYRKYIQENQQQRQQEAAASSKTGAPGAASSSSSSGGAAGAAPSKARPTAAEQGAARAWCHTFDLTRSMDQAVVDKAGMVGGGAGGAATQPCHVARGASFCLKWPLHLDWVHKSPK